MFVNYKNNMHACAGHIWKYQLYDRLELTLQAALTSLITGSMVRGPREQLMPTTSAPASSNFLQASGNGTSSNVISGSNAVNVITAGIPLNKQHNSVIERPPVYPLLAVKNRPNFNNLKSFLCF